MGSRKLKLLACIKQRQMIAGTTEMESTTVQCVFKIGINIKKNHHFYVKNILEKIIMIVFFHRKRLLKAKVCRFYMYVHIEKDVFKYLLKLSPCDR